MTISSLNLTTKNRTILLITPCYQLSLDEWYVQDCWENRMVLEYESFFHDMEDECNSLHRHLRETGP